MKKLFITAMILVISPALFGQKATYLGVEAAITNNLYEYADNGNKQKSIPLISGMWGFNLRQDLNNNFSIETGLIRKYYDYGFGFRTSLVNGFSSNAINTWQIPLRIRPRLNLFKDKIFFTTVVGYHYCINSDYNPAGSGGGGGKIYGSGDSISYNYTVNKNMAKTFSLLETGAGFEFKLFRQILLTVSASYYTGFRKIIEMDVSYTVNSDPPQTAKIFSKGGYWNIGAGLRYPISNLWTKGKQE